MRKYLSVDNDNNIIFPPNTDSFEICENCRTDLGFAQDDKYLCSRGCIGDNQFSSQVLSDQKLSEDKRNKSCCSGKSTDYEPTATCHPNDRSCQQDLRIRGTYKYKCLPK
jgi:hypothetical protein